MATVNDVTSSSVVASAPVKKHKGANDLNVNDFMQLMTAQLKNQDPLKPLDSTSFVAQLAQFGTVSGVQGMQTSLANLSSALQSAQMLSGASLVGHQILTAADASNYSGAGTVDGMVEVPAGAARVQLTVTDSSGQAVRHIELSAAEGAQRFSWDGKSDTGAALAAGHYKIQVLSGDAQTNESLQTYITGRVSSVSLDAGGAGLTVNTQELGSIGLNAVREVI